jgi:hypothetical protein
MHTVTIPPELQAEYTASTTADATEGARATTTSFAEFPADGFLSYFAKVVILENMFNIAELLTNGVPPEQIPAIMQQVTKQNNK